MQHCSLTFKTCFAEKLLQKKDQIQTWLKNQVPCQKFPLYSSVDLRDAGFKIAPVDTNLFPSGFHHICKKDLLEAPAYFQNILKSLFQSSETPFPSFPKKILLIPELHTRNPHYLSHLESLCNILEQIFEQVCLGWIDPSTQASFSQKTPSGKALTFYPLKIKNRRVWLNTFSPDFILLNHDFSSKPPQWLFQLDTPIFPSPKQGWHFRKKNVHFQKLEELFSTFANLLSLDPWFFVPKTQLVEPVDFSILKNIDQVAQAASQILNHTKKMYRRYQIEQKPFVVIKNNQGTYGMGVLTLEDPKELFTLNRRKKNKMSTGKNKIPIQSVLVQEGIPTLWKGAQGVAEPVIYNFGSQPIGGFLRIHSKKSTQENLNSPGMVFQSLCMSDWNHMFEQFISAQENLPILELIYGTIASLAAGASALEVMD